MADYTPQQLADELNSLHARALSIVEGTISGAANPGGSVTFTYRLSDGQTATATGTAWNACSPSKVSALKMADDQWIVVGRHEAARVRSSIHVDRRARPVEKKGGNIKVLFSVIEGEDRVFYVGGDRAVPKRIHAIPVGDVKAALTNTDKKNGYIVGIVWTEETIAGPIIHMTGVSNNGGAWEIISTRRLLAAGINSYSDDFGPTSTQEPIYYTRYDFGFFGYYGNGFWAQVPSDSQNFIRASVVGINNFVVETSGSTVITARGGWSSNTNEGADSAVNSTFGLKYPPGASTGGGFYSKTIAISHPAGNASTTTTTSFESFSQDFDFEIASISAGNISKLSGSTASARRSSSARKDYDLQTGDTTTGSRNDSASQTIKLQITPKIVRTSTEMSSFTGGVAFEPGGGLVGDLRVELKLGSVSQIYDSRIPALVGDREQGIYRHTGATYSAAVDAAGGTNGFLVNPGSFSRPTFTDYYLAFPGDQQDIKLGGTLPAELFVFSSGFGQSKEKFSPRDTLIDSKYYRVTIEAGLFDRCLPLGVDIYALSATTTKRTVKQKVFKLPTPTSGMPATPEGIAALNARLKDSLPVTIGNMTIHNASYHP